MKLLLSLAGVVALSLAVLIGFVFTNKLKMESPVEIEPIKKAPRTRSKPVETELS